MAALIASGQAVKPSLAPKVDFAKIESLKDADETISQKELAKALLLHYRSKPNLYLAIDKNDKRFLQTSFPDEVKGSIKVADEVSRHYFLFRYEWDMEKTSIPYQFKGSIDWKVIPFGDAEWTYMLNRHRYWMDLGKAYYFTGSEKYAQTWVKQVTSWIKNNPLEDKSILGLTWRRIEAGIRCENWIKSWELMKHSKAITPEFTAMFINSLHEHAVYINSSYSDFSKTSNWGILEYHGLVNAAAFLSEFKESGKWMSDALHKLAMCADIQMLPDGTQWEQSPMYHNEVFHSLMNVVYIAKKQGIEVPEIIKEKVSQMAHVNVQWQKPNYKQPLIGDSDDSDLRGLLTLSAYLYNDGVLKSRANTKVDYENYFILGSKGAAVYDDIKPVSPDYLSVYQQSSGDVFMRDSWGEDANYLHFHVKRIGDGHAHDDLLHLSLFANGRDYLVDGGRYTYTETKERKLLKSSESHNGIGVDGQPNSIYSNTWGNSFNAKGVDVAVKFTPQFDYAQSTNTGYQRLDNPVTATRKVVYIKPGLWIVFDNFVGKGEHKYSQFFGFADTNVEASENRISTTYESDNLIIDIVKPADIVISDGVWSPEYNTLTRNKRAEVSVTTKGSHSFISALYFPSKSDVTIKPVEVLSRGDGKLGTHIAEAVEINYNGKEYIVMIVNNPQSPVNPFYKVKGVIVAGDAVVLEKTGNGYKRHVLAE